MARTTAMDLTKGRPIRQILLFSLPLVAGTLFQQLYSFVDTIMVGRLIGEDALAAVGTTYSLHFLTLGFVQGACVGFAIPLAQAIGAQDARGFRRYFWNGVWLCTALAAVMTALTFALAGPLLTLIQTPAEIFADARRYIGIIFLGIPATVLYNFSAGALRASGDSRRPTLFLLVSSLLNILLDYVFIVPIPLGVAGAALATVLSQLASCIFVLVFLFGRQPPIRITFGGYSARIMGRVMATGFTPFIIIAFDNVMIIALNSLLQKYGGAGQGDLLVAAATIAQSFMLVVTMPLGGITGGTGSILGYNYGAGQPKRILEAQKFILLLCLGYTTLLFLIGQGVPGLFVSIFSSDPQVGELAVRAIRIYTLGVIPLAVQYTVIDGFTGMGMMQYSLPLSFFRKAIYFIPLFVLPMYFGAMSTFVAEPISDFVAPVVSAFVYWRRIRYVVGLKPKKAQ